MPTSLKPQATDRKAAERAILEALEKSNDHSMQMSDIFLLLLTNFDEGTARRAVLRLAATGKAVLDANLNVEKAA